MSVNIEANSLAKVVDWEGARQLAEAGVPLKKVAALFKVNPVTIYAKSRQMNWLTPHNIEKQRKELQNKLVEKHLRGERVDVVKAKAEVWEERGERMREQAFAITEDALKGALKKKKGRTLIQESKDLVNIVNVASKVAGLDAKDAAAAAPKMAVNVNFLRSQPQPIDV